MSEKSFCDTVSFAEAHKFLFLDDFLSDFGERLVITDVIMSEWIKLERKMKKEGHRTSKDFSRKLSAIEQRYSSKTDPPPYRDVHGGEWSCISIMLEEKKHKQMITEDSDVLRHGESSPEFKALKFLPIMVYILDSNQNKKMKYINRLRQLYETFYTNLLRKEDFPESLKNLLEVYAEDELGLTLHG